MHPADIGSLWYDQLTASSLTNERENQVVVECPESSSLSSSSPGAREAARQRAPPDEERGVVPDWKGISGAGDTSDSVLSGILVSGGLLLGGLLLGVCCTSLLCVRKQKSAQRRQQQQQQLQQQEEEYLQEEGMPAGGYDAHVDGGGEYGDGFEPPYVDETGMMIEMEPEGTPLGEQSLHSGSESDVGIEIIAAEAAAAAQQQQQRQRQAVATVGEIISFSSRSAGEIHAAAPHGAYSVHAVTPGGDNADPRCQLEARLPQRCTISGSSHASGSNPWGSQGRDSADIPNLGERFARDTDDVLLPANEEGEEETLTAQEEVSAAASGVPTLGEERCAGRDDSDDVLLFLPADEEKRLTDEETSVVDAPVVVDINVSCASVASVPVGTSPAETLAAASAIPAADVGHRHLLDDNHAVVAIDNNSISPGQEMITGCATGIAIPREDEME